MKKISEGNHDKAWNDPPMFAYQGSTAPRRRTALNKRVPFPLNSCTPVSGATTVPSMTANTATTPPTVLARSDDHPSLPPPAVTAAATCGPDEESASQQTSSCVASGDIKSTDVGSILVTLLDSVTSSLDSSTLQEVSLRVAVISELYQQDRLSPDVKSALEKIVQALQQKELAVAEESLRALSVDHAAELSAGWISALRQILFHIKQHASSSSPTAC